ncbi:ACT domain-containing protein [Fusobacterium sp. PH5-44]|uniref:ACT domain-containing protein n=1 Tax=unclassified Fusobacterium TaxID=2648384 RepID=UPI003D240911
MNAILSVIGKDTVGILATVSNECVKYNANITDVSQSVIGDFFAMIMVVNLDKLNVEFTKFVDAMKVSGKEKNLEIHVMHEDIFNSMHKI